MCFGDLAAGGRSQCFPQPPGGRNPATLAAPNKSQQQQQLGANLASELLAVCSLMQPTYWSEPRMHVPQKCGSSLHGIKRRLWLNLIYPRAFVIYKPVSSSPPCQSPHLHTRILILRSISPVTSHHSPTFTFLFLLSLTAWGIYFFANIPLKKKSSALHACSSVTCNMTFFRLKCRAALLSLLQSNDLNAGSLNGTIGMSLWWLGKWSPQKPFSFVHRTERRMMLNTWILHLSCDCVRISAEMFFFGGTWRPASSQPAANRLRVSC